LGTLLGTAGVVEGAEGLGGLGTLILPPSLLPGNFRHQWFCRCFGCCLEQASCRPSFHLSSYPCHPPTISATGAGILKPSGFSKSAYGNKSLLITLAMKMCHKVAGLTATGHTAQKARCCHRQSILRRIGWE